MRAEDVNRKYNAFRLRNLMQREGNEPLEELIDALWDDRSEIIKMYNELNRELQKMLADKRRKPNEKEHSHEN